MLLENGSDVILTIDDQWQIGYASPSLKQVLGWAPDQVAQHPLAEFIHPDDAEGVQAALEGAVSRSGFGEPIAFRFRHADGSWRSLEAVGSHPRDWPGSEHIIVTARDITPRERLESQLRQAQKMEALGRFAAGVAHDFNNLLTAIQGYASLLLFDLGPIDPRREDLEEIRKASERAAGLTRQILAFSRRHVGEPELGGPQSHRGSHPADAAPPHRRRRRVRPRAGAGARRRASGSAPARAGGDEPGGERARRDAGGRPADGRDRERAGGRGRSARLSGPAAGPVRPGHRARHRDRHRAGDSGQDLRSLLHDEGAGPRHRPRARHRVRDREADRRAHRAG